MSNRQHPFLPPFQLSISFINISPATHIEVTDAEVSALRDFQCVLKCMKKTVLDVVKDTWHDCLLLALLTIIAPHAVLNIIVDDEVELFVGKAVVLGKDSVDCAYNFEGHTWIEFIIFYSSSGF